MPPECKKCGYHHSFNSQCESPRRSVKEELTYMVIKKGDEAYRFFFDSFKDASARAKQLTQQGNGNFMVYELIEYHERFQPEPIVKSYRRK